MAPDAPRRARVITIHVAAIGLSALLAAQVRPDRVDSPNGELYAIEQPGERLGPAEERERFVVYTAAGVQVSVAHVWLVEPDGTRRVGIRECEDRGWVDDARLFCEGTINPSTAVYLVFDARTGKELEERIGLRFTWSPDRKRMAHYGNVPDSSDVNDKSDSLQVDGTEGYPSDDDRGTHWFRSPLAWAADSRSVAVVDHRRSQGDFVLAVVSISDRVVTYPLAWKPELEDWPPPKDFALRWDGTRVVVTHESREQSVVVR